MPADTAGTGAQCAEESAWLAVYMLLSILAPQMPTLHGPSQGILNVQRFLKGRSPMIQHFKYTCSS